MSKKSFYEVTDIEFLKEYQQVHTEYGHEHALMILSLRWKISKKVIVNRLKRIAAKLYKK